VPLAAESLFDSKRLEMKKDISKKFPLNRTLPLRDIDNLHSAARSSPVDTL
jgi:hypothetical protein